MITKELYSDDESIWLGMSNYRLTLKQSNQDIVMKYIGEPPNGDSYYKIELNGKLLKGFFWGCMYLFPYNQRFMVASWMETLYERKTIVVDFYQNVYKVLDKYWYDYREIENKVVLINSDSEEVKTIDLFTLNEWTNL